MHDVRKAGKRIFFLVAFLVMWLGNPKEVYASGETVTVEVNYIRYNGDYDDWSLWLWQDDQEGASYSFEKTEDGVKTVVQLNNVTSDSSIGIIVRRGNWEEKDGEAERYLDLGQIKNGKLTVYLWQGQEEISYDKQEIGNRIVDASLESETEVHFRAYIPNGEDELLITDQDGNIYEIEKVEKTEEGAVVSGDITLAEAVVLPNAFYLTVGEAETLICFSGIYDTEYFISNFVYDGDDLGAVYSPDRTDFAVWSPMAVTVAVNLYDNGSEGEAYASYPMERSEKGVWRLTIAEDLKNVYYTYSVNVTGEEHEVVDPYAKSTGVNGLRGMILSEEETDPEGFEKDSYISTIERDEVILYEMSVRDYTMDENSGVEAKGTFLGLTEEGTTNAGGDSTGLSYLAELGITHVHLLPIMDFEGVDETKIEESYNWGYMPKSYFVPEGSYSTDPYHGQVRVNECKQMVQSLHSKGIGVVMDVVYNHTDGSEDSNLSYLVPGYYYRMNEDGSYSSGSGCGNELATQRAMVRKYIIDSLTYWMEEYHIDGFRFDLMGLIDLDTMQEIEKTVYQINENAVLYGEGWNAGKSVYEGETLESVNAWQTPKIGTFNNVFRRAVQKYICSFTEEESTLIGMRYGFVGAGKNENTMEESGSWTENPLQCINYASCHDGYTMWDLITLSCPEESQEEWIRRDCFGAASVLLCQGTPFFQSGEEFLRTKTSESNPDVKYSNSYNAGDAVNHIDWGKRTEYKDVAEYYKGLIAFRKEHTGLRYQTQEQLNENLIFMEDLPENVMGYYLSEPYLFFVDKQICLAFNPTEEAVEFTPVSGKWNVYVNAQSAGTEIIQTIKKGENFTIEGISAFAAVRMKVRMDRILIVVGCIAAVGIIAAVIKKR